MKSHFVLGGQPALWLCFSQTDAPAARASRSSTIILTATNSSPRVCPIIPRTVIMSIAPCNFYAGNVTPKSTRNVRPPDKYTDMQQKFQNNSTTKSNKKANTGRSSTKKSPARARRSSSKSDSNSKVKRHPLAITSYFKPKSKEPSTSKQDQNSNENAKPHDDDACHFESSQKTPLKSQRQHGVNPKTPLSENTFAENCSNKCLTPPKLEKNIMANDKYLDVSPIVAFDDLDYQYDYSYSPSPSPSKLNEGKLEGAPRGLRNFGNNCYVNSVIQSFFSFKFFTDALEKCFNDFKDAFSLESLPEKHDLSLEDYMKEHLPILFRIVELHRNYLVVTCTSGEIEKQLRDLKCYVGNNYDQAFGTQFGKDAQQDAAEFFTVILELLYKEIVKMCELDACKSIANPVAQYFQYNLAYQTVCAKCNETSTQNDNANIFHLQITVDRALQSSFLKHISQEESSISCSKCNIKKSQVKSFEKLPKVLVIQAARYGESFNKDSTGISAPHSIYLPRSFINKSVPISPLSTPYKKSLKRLGDSVDNKKKPCVKKLKFCDDDESKSESLLATDDIDGEKEENLSSEPNLEATCTLSEAFDHKSCERYQLVSIICHYGRSANVGHYVSYIFNFEHSKWYLCDDFKCTNVDYETLFNDAASSGLLYLYVHTD